MAKKAKQGRPVGSKNRTYDESEATVTTCKKCGSTNRGPYYGKNEQVHDGKLIIRRRTVCQDCGQFRIDRTELPV